MPRRAAMASSGSSRGSNIKNMMRRACQAAGLALFSPHDLRHRYASVQIARGVLVTNVAAQLGHSRNSMTLDVYSHVLLHG
jgi:integrase